MIELSWIYLIILTYITCIQGGMCGVDSKLSIIYIIMLARGHRKSMRQRMYICNTSHICMHVESTRSTSFCSYNVCEPEHYSYTNI